jgi:hypothetical protein
VGKELFLGFFIPNHNPSCTRAWIVALLLLLLISHITFVALCACFVVLYVCLLLTCELYNTYYHIYMVPSWHLTISGFQN